MNLNSIFFKLYDQFVMSFNIFNFHTEIHIYIYYIDTLTYKHNENKNQQLLEQQKNLNKRYIYL